MATSEAAKPLSDATKDFFNAHSARELVQNDLSPEAVWRHLCNVNMLRPRSRDGHQTKLYETLLGEWKTLSIDASQKWTQDLETRLGSNEKVDDFFAWRKNRLHLARPDYNRLDAYDFARFLHRADWNQTDLMAQIVTGYLWRSGTSGLTDYLLGWYDIAGVSSALGLRLNARIFDLDATALDLCVDLGVSTLLPHMFVGIRYQPDDSPTEKVVACGIVLGKFEFEEDLVWTIFMILNLTVTIR